MANFIQLLADDNHNINEICYKEKKKMIFSCNN